MDEIDRYIAFSIDDLKCAVPISSVERVLNAVEVTELPWVTEVIRGVIDVHGKVIPVINLRKRFHLPAREIAASDKFIVGIASNQSLVLWVDRVTGIIERRKENGFQGQEILSGANCMSEGANQAEGVFVLVDLNKLLTVEDQERLGRDISAGKD